MRLDRAPTLGVPLDMTRVAHSFGGWAALESARRDARIDIVFPPAPGFRNGATDAFVATLARPSLIVGGSLDDTCEFPANQRAPYMKAQTPKYLLPVVVHARTNSVSTAFALRYLWADPRYDPYLADPAVLALGNVMSWSAK